MKETDSNNSGRTGLRWGRPLAVGIALGGAMLAGQSILGIAAIVFATSAAIYCYGRLMVVRSSVTQPAIAGSANWPGFEMACFSINSQVVHRGTLCASDGPDLGEIGSDGLVVGQHEADDNGDQSQAKSPWHRRIGARYPARSERASNADDKLGKLGKKKKK